MATAAEYNQFRRLIGDFGKNLVDTTTIDSYLNDAVAEVTADFSVPVTDFNTLVKQYHPEVVIWAAINWWWNVAAKLVEHHSQSAGQATHQASEKWERAMRMIETLTTRYGEVQTLGTDVSIGNLSRFSKLTYMRVGGQREEDFLDDL